MSGNPNERLEDYDNDEDRCIHPGILFLRYYLIYLKHANLQSIGIVQKMGAPVDQDFL